VGLRILTVGLPNRKAQEEPQMSVVDRQLEPLRPGIGGNGSGIKAPKSLAGFPWHWHGDKLYGVRAPHGRASI